MKKCCKCGESKYENEFGLQRKYKKDGTRKSLGRRSECKICYNAYMREYLSGRESHKTLVKKHKQEKCDFVSNLKLEFGCVKCGYKKCARALHFHHLDKETKDFEISWATFRGVSIEKLEKEIAKCQLLCSNCHAEEEESQKIASILPG